MADGSSHFMQDSIEPQMKRTLVTRSENDVNQWSPCGKPGSEFCVSAKSRF